MNEDIIVTLKLKSGDDIIGFYLEETDNSNLEKSILLYKPIKIKQILQVNQNTGHPIFSYQCDLYSLYGATNMVTIPYSMISSRDIASDFFCDFYKRNLRHLISFEESLQEFYSKSYYNQHLHELMSNTDSLYVEQYTEYLQ